jgi:hypothetical protein
LYMSPCFAGCLSGRVGSRGNHRAGAGVTMNVPNLAFSQSRRGIAQKLALALFRQLFKLRRVPNGPERGLGIDRRGLIGALCRRRSSPNRKPGHLKEGGEALSQELSRTAEDSSRARAYSSETPPRCLASATKSWIPSLRCRSATSMLSSRRPP